MFEDVWLFKKNGHVTVFDTFSPKSPQKQGSKGDLLPANSFFQNLNFSTIVSFLESTFFERELSFSFFYGIFLRDIA